MNWEMTTGRAWPAELVEGEYPSRGTNAVDENNRVLRLLSEGWEPFAVVAEHEATQVWLKREAHNTDRSQT